MTMLLQNLAERIGARMVGNGATEIDGCAPIQSAGPREITFLANPIYLRFLETTKAGAVLLGEGTAAPERLNRVFAPDPYFAFRQTMIELHGFRHHPVPMDAPASEADAPLVSPLASVHRDALLGDRTLVHPHVTIEAGARVGTDCVLYPGAYVGIDARIGDGCLLYPNAVIYDHCIIGDRVTLHANTVIGQDGFGYATHQGAHHKIPQAGIVVIEDDVELGAGCAIERAAMGETRIGRGTKFADLISIGHGTTIGQHCLFVSLVGVSGSVDVGNYVVLGGQVGVTGHLRIGDGVQAAGKTAIINDVEPGMKVGGIPGQELQKAKRNALVANNLYELARRVRVLERRLDQKPEEK